LSVTNHEFMSAVVKSPPVRPMISQAKMAIINFQVEDMLFILFI
jgi:hypothetical protein